MSDVRGKVIHMPLKQGAMNNAIGNLFQYDQGQILMFDDVELPQNYFVDFSNCQYAPAKKQIGHADGVEIPNEYLLSGEPVYIWVVLNVGADDRETEFRGVIKVQQRGEPTNDEPTPTQRSIIEEAIATLNSDMRQVDEAIEHVEDVAEHIDQSLESKADKADTVLTTTLSRGRKENTTTGEASFAFGANVEASGNYSHAEGGSTKASGYAAHAEGVGTQAVGDYSHAEGSGAQANGSNAHAEGAGTQANGACSHAEGSGSRATATNSHAEGASTLASSYQAHAEGAGTQATGSGSHSEGQSTIASGAGAHSEGQNTLASGNGAHSEGYNTGAIGANSHAEGAGTHAHGDVSHSEGNGTSAYGPYSHAEGNQTQANTTNAHAEGEGTEANGRSSHAEGRNTDANGDYSHAEGYETQATGASSHAEGDGAHATGANAHAEGYSTHATGSKAHAEGYSTYASGATSHAEGDETISAGENSHAEGEETEAHGRGSHAGGKGTVANGQASTVVGRHNVPDSLDDWDEWEPGTDYVAGQKVKRTIGTTVTGYICRTDNDDHEFDSSKWYITAYMNFAFIVGNGEDGSESNAAAIDWEGNMFIQGDLYIRSGYNSTGGKRVATMEDIERIELCHICTAQEYNQTTRVPTIANPSTKIIYLVPSADTASSDLFIEWIYADDGWERFGSAAMDITGKADIVANAVAGHLAGLDANGNLTDSGYAASDIGNKADKTDTILLTTLSRGRASGSTVGLGSIAWGNEVVASGDVAFAMGNGATASGASAFAMGSGVRATGLISFAFGMGVEASASCAHAEGSGTHATATNAHAEGAGVWATGSYSHAEGGGTLASGDGAHAEGGGSQANGLESHAEGSSCHADGAHSHAEGIYTVAGGQASHASGIHTSAEGTASFAFGMYNKEDSASNIPTWEPNHSPSYKYGEIVKRVVDGNTIRSMCINPNSSAEFDDSDWFTISEIGKFAEIVGNGYTISDEYGEFYVYSNARALDWAGNEYLMGDVYVGCGAGSTGGTRLAKISEIPTVPVTDVQVDGTSILNNGVANIPIADRSTPGVIMVGAGMTVANGFINPATATDDHIKGGTATTRMISPSNQHKSVYYALSKLAGIDLANGSDAVGVYPDNSKQAIQKLFGFDGILGPYESDSIADKAYAIGETFIMNGKRYKATAAISLGDVLASGTNCELCPLTLSDVQINNTSIIQNGIASIPKATNSVYGIMRVGAGLSVYEDRVITNPATEAQMKAGTAQNVPITPFRQHLSVFYALSKLAGVDLASETVTVGTYPANSKTAIRGLIDAVGTSDFATDAQTQAIIAEYEVVSA